MSPTRRDFLQNSVALAGTAGLLLTGLTAHAASPGVTPSAAGVAAAAGTPATASAETPPQSEGGNQLLPTEEAPMRFIGLEEHFITPEIQQASERLPPDQRDDILMQLRQSPELMARLQDLGEGRLRQMDGMGLDLMVVSATSPATQILAPREAVALARQANDRLAAAVRAHPTRLAGFATLPTPAPAAAAQELRRAVRELGFKGALIHGRTGDKYLDHPDFRPLLAQAAALDVPIYLHPQIVPRAVRTLYYDGFDEKLSLAFATSGWGWHADAGVGALRLILAGVFDELPTLQIIIGHWGELVTFFLDRANILSEQAKHLKKPVADYFRQNFYLTPSGIFSPAYLQSAVAVMGADRVLFSTDYPYLYQPGSAGRDFLASAALSLEDKHKIAHGNAERLLKLT